MIESGNATIMALSLRRRGLIRSGLVMELIFSSRLLSVKSDRYFV